MLVQAGATDVTTYFVLRTAADGVELTAATITNLDLQYTRSGVAPTAKVDATALAATDSAHSDNKAIEIDATDQPGLYRVDWPDAAFAAGVREVILTVKYATAFTEHLRVQIDAPVDVQKWNGTDVPSEHTAGYPIVTVKDGTGTGEINTNGGKVVGVELVDTLTTYTGNTPQTGDSFARIGATGSGLTSLASQASLNEIIAPLVPVAAATVNDAAATTTSFKTTLTDVDDFWNDARIVFTSGALAGQSRPILDFANTNGVITLDEALTSAPANGVAFAIVADHIHPISQIQSGLATSAAVADLPTNAELATALGTADDAVLTQIALVKAKTDSLTFTVANVLDANIQRVNDVAITGDGSGTPFNV